jgi:phthiocerol/phenolphthiocerol synthesis type-I polyketide synthase E
LIWKALLKIDTIHVTDDFFEDLGGDSLLAVLLFLEIEKAFGRRFPASSLYQAPTIEKMAKLLDGDVQNQKLHSLVPIKPSGTESPLFLVHGAGGNILIYRNLVRRLSGKLPIYGLQSYGLDDASQPLLTIEEMASAYIRELKTIQPFGPYLPCGYCMGGTVALEMSQQLKRGGDDVVFLAMLETYNWSRLPHRSIYDRAKFLGQKGLFHWMNFWLLNKSGQTSFLANKFSDLRSRTRIWAGRLLSLLSKRAVSSNPLARQSEIWKLNDRACFSYHANFYDGRMTIFLPKKKYSVHSVPEAMWTHDQAMEIDLVTLPFYPAAMLVEPFVQELAKNITSKIAKALTQLPP